MPKDRKHKSLVEELLNTSLDEERLIHTEGTLQVYDLDGLINDKPSAEEIALLKQFAYTEVCTGGQKIITNT